MCKTSFTKWCKTLVFITTAIVATVAKVERGSTFRETCLTTEARKRFTKLRLCYTIQRLLKQANLKKMSRRPLKRCVKNKNKCIRKSWTTTNNFIESKFPDFNLLVIENRLLKKHLNCRIFFKLVFLDLPIRKESALLQSSYMAVLAE